jgi:hypothetical protein
MLLALAVALFLGTLPGCKAFDFEKCESDCKTKWNIEVNWWDAPSYANCMTDCAHRAASAAMHGGGGDEL